MPSNASAVGKLALPLPSTPANSSLDDPLLLGLLDYFAFWLNANLNPKLASMGAGQAAEAVPAGKRYPYNPERAFVRTAIPALYMWRGDRPGDVRYERWTIWQQRRITMVRALWLYSEQVIPTGAVTQNGLLTAADSTLWTATEYGYRNDYAYNGGPAGQVIWKTLKVEGYEYLGSDAGILWKLPGDSPVGASSPGRGGDGAAQRGYPALQASWEIHELLEPRDADALQGDSRLSTSIDGLPIGERDFYGPLPEDD